MDALRRVQSSTGDPAEADALLREAGGRFAFSRDPGSDFAFRVNQAGDEGVDVGVYRIDGEWQSDGEFDRFGVSGVFSGDYRWEIDGDRDSGYATPFLSRPGHELFGHGDDLTIVNVYITPERLTEVARQVYADDRIAPVFDSPRPIDPQRSLVMLQTLQVAAEYVRSGAIGHPLVRASLFHQLAVGALETFPLLRDGERAPVTRRAEATVYRRATRFIDDCLSLPITLGDVAAAAGTDLHTLTAVFRSRTGTGAGSYLRGARLSAAQVDRMAEPALSDAALAARWGFASEDRFRRAYGSAFGAAEGPR
ncbi:helix-turn-helix domain-containing protein [Leifsonia sp. NPDC056824]|uniref:helix-turn-helix transcriptional regulator n=1 Tax=Leifsonia sp. NPDC056824 TaxID=3345953 RepID=UPI00368D00F3